jgi:ABC-type glycerol-3-phosphate transport system substrate-binding protein
MAGQRYKVSRRQFLSAGIGATIGTGAFGRAGAFAAEKPITVGTMPGPRWEGALSASAAAYKAKTGTPINLIVNPFVEHYQKIATTLATDSSNFDVFVFDAALLGQSYSKLAPLDKLFDTDSDWKKYYLNGVPEVYRGSWSWDGAPYAVVHDSNAMMAWWRTDVFAENKLPEPTTFEIMLDNAKKLSSLQPHNGFMTTAARGAYLAVLYTGMMWAFGGRWWENDAPNRYGRISKQQPPGTVLLDSSENVAAMTMLRDLIAVGNPGSLNAVEFENNGAFINGTVTQQLIWSGLMVLQDRKLNPNYFNKLVSRDFPLGGSNKDATSTGIKGGFGLAIPKASQQIDRAFDFCKFVTSRENADVFIGGGGQPANATLLKDWSAKPGFQVFATVADGILHGHHQAQFPEGGQFYDIISNNVASVLTEGKDPQAACIQMKRDTEALLKRAGYI